MDAHCLTCSNVFRVDGWRQDLSCPACGNDEAWMHIASGILGQAANDGACPLAADIDEKIRKCRMMLVEQKLRVTAKRPFGGNAGESAKPLENLQVSLRALERLREFMTAEPPVYVSVSRLALSV